MPAKKPVDVYEDARIWNERGLFWETELDVKSNRHRQTTVVVAGNGIALRVRNGALEITHGRSCASQAPVKQVIHPGKFRRPNAIILLHCSGFLTIEAFEWLAQQDVPLITMDWKLDRTAVLTADCNVRNAIYNEPLVREQYAIAANTGRSLAITRMLIADKIRHSIGTLKAIENWALLPRTPNLPMPSMQRLTRSQDRLEECLCDVPHVTTLDDQYGIEGKAAFAYFAAWRGLPLQWSGIGRRPIPAEWHWIGQRKSLAAPTKLTSVRNRGNRHATHPMNAMQNYAYAVLQARIKLGIVSAGLDPNVGIMHGAQPDKSASPLPLIFDLMEPLRPIVDRTVLLFALDNTFRPQDFAILSGIKDVPDGAVRLHPQLARHVVRLVDEAIAPAAAKAGAAELSELPRLVTGVRNVFLAGSNAGC
jgi:CRISP-associated protein Cas1